MIETVPPRREWPLGAALFAAAFALRAISFPNVFTAGRIEFFGFDAYYHMRRVLYATANFPSSLDFDPYLKFPHGARPIWTPVFDTALAWLALPFSALWGEPGVAVAASFVPPLLGAATVVCLWRFALTTTDRATAFAAGAILAVLSAHSWYSQIGFVDHHAPVALLCVVLVAAAAPLLRSADAVRFRPSVLLGACMAGCLLVWPGMLAHLFLAEAALWIHMVTRPSAARARAAALELALAHATALVLLIPFTLGDLPEQFGPFSSVVLSYFQPWLMGTLSLTACAAAVLFGGTRAGSGTTSRTVTAFGVGLTLLGSSAVLFAELPTAVVDALRWLTKDEAFQASVGESQPLFYTAGEWQRFIAELRFGRTIYLFPLALIGWLAAARNRSDRPVWLSLALWAVGLAALTWVQRRFMNSFSVAYALVMGWAIVWLWRAFVARLSDSSGARVGVAAVLLLAMLFALEPTLRSYGESVSGALTWLRGGLAAPDRSKAQKFGVLLVGDWLRAHSPGTSGYLEASVEPEYGVLSLWGDGHVLRYAARRPVVTDNFGDDVGPENMDASRRYFAASDEATAVQELDRLRARYVVVRPAGSASGPMFQRLYRNDGTGLAQHRMVFESPRAERTIGQAPLKVFERVPGALVHGRAEPGALVTATLTLRSQRGRAFGYEATAVAGSDGQYALRLPHATTSSDDERVRATSSYVVRSGAASGKVAVDEASVLAGGRIEGPSLQP